jgi:hypothetical protein
VRDAPQERTRPPLAVVRARSATQAPFLPSLPQRLVAHHALHLKLGFKFVLRVQLVIATLAIQDQMEVSRVAASEGGKEIEG